MKQTAHTPTYIKSMPEEIRRLEAINNALVEALEFMILDLENNGEMLETDDKRIEFMQNALKQAKGE